MLKASLDSFSASKHVKAPHKNADISGTSVVMGKLFYYTESRTGNMLKQLKKTIKKQK